MQKKYLVIGAFFVLLLGVTYLLDFRTTLPAQQLRTVNNESLALIDGKPVLINIWATDCPGCVEEMPKLNALYEKYQQQGFRVLAIAMQYDNLAAIKTFVADLQLTFPIVYDEAGDIVAKITEVYALPMSFLVDAEGRVVAKSLGEPDWQSWEQQLRAMLS